MHTHRLSIGMLLLTGLLFQSAFATVSLRVFSKDEGLNETNIVKPRFYIQNTGTEPLSNFYCFYNFTVEQNKTPILEDYYTPDAIATLEKLNNGNCRVRFLFSGVTLNPGQTAPNPDGEIVGLRYSDWSQWDKTNDKSNPGTGTFTLSGTIPVYSADGTLIYGNEVPDPPIPPQPPQVLTGSSDYAVLSSEYTDIRDRAIVKGGNVGSGAYVEVGATAIIYGSAFSGGSMFLRDRDTIKGDAVAQESINKQNNIVITGSTRSYAQVDIPLISVTPVLFGTKDTTVPANGTCDLQPGSYKDFHAFSNAVITLHPGNYSFNTFIVEPDVRIILKVSNLERINLSVQSDLHFSDRTQISFEQGISYPYSIKLYSSQTGLLFIGNNCQIYGNIISPDAEVHVYSNTNINGAIYGKKVVIEPGSVVCKPPLLQDLWHSEWAYSPSFDPAVFDYKAVVTDATSTLIISAIAANGTTVTVNGQSPTNPVNLTNTTTDISLSLNNPDQCGSTVYDLKVSKSTNFQIFVNDNSPCAPGKEDGNSWGTAYKDLQQAINRALIDGKEIWVAEGTYKPSLRTDSNDPRSATFMVYSGIEIKGGFKGNEIEDKTEGSPYNTILTGDISANDSRAATWPPTGTDCNYFTDNVYHVVTIAGSNRSTAVHLRGFIIEHGFANGTGVNANGAGIYVKNCNPTFELVGIRKNFSASGGAGLYVNSSIKSIENCLFKDNYSFTGSGAGLYFPVNSPLTINASVFDGNTTRDTSGLQGGSAIYIKGAQLQMVNCIATRNSSSSTNGSLFNDGGTATITNCTFAYDTCVKGAPGIKNSNNGKATVLNSIFWNSESKPEFSGGGFTVTYSCITGGYMGAGNISDEPLFVAKSNPEGTDSVYGNNDDGLFLSKSSPCINNGTSINAPGTDILSVLRPAGGSFDIGAYEYVDSDKCNKLFFGKLRNGVFYENNDLDIIERMIHPNEIYQYSRSSFHRVMRAYVENNDYTKNKESITMYIEPTDSNGTVIASEIEVNLSKIGVEDGLLVFQSMTPEYNGKKVIFTSERGWHGYENPWAYVVYVSGKPGINYRVPNDQFNGGR